jgi:glycosyltransferase involved in cell wall biosynthesis
MKYEIKNLFGKPLENIHVVPNGIDIHKFDGKEIDWDFRRNYARDNEKIIFFAGRIVYEKGIQVLLEAAPKIFQNYNDCKIVIAGRGPCLEDLRAQAERLGISNRVYFTGYLNDKQITKMYKAINVATFPSLYEPFGIVALEGMLAGAATVVSDTGGLNEIISHGIDGMKSYTGNANSLADSILEVLYNQDLCNQITANAKEKVCKEYNWDIIGKKTMDVYKQTIKEAKVAKVKFVERLVKKTKEPEVSAPTYAQDDDNTITTSSTDKEIRGILPNPLSKLRGTV